jgi:hypothetical protein
MNTFSNDIVYHATQLKHWESIKNRILIHREDADFNLDFGKGFYTTSLFQQAKDRARYLEEKSGDNKGIIARQDRGIIIKFELDFNLLYNISKDKFKIFEPVSEEWAEYVARNRVSKQEIKNGYLWVYGSLADGAGIGSLCRKFMNHHITPSQFIHGYTDTETGQFIRGISPYHKHYDQLSFHEDESFVNSVLKSPSFVFINEQEDNRRWKV